MSLLKDLIERRRVNGGAPSLPTSSAPAVVPTAAPTLDRATIIANDPLIKSLGADATRIEELAEAGDGAGAIELAKSIVARSVEGYANQLVKSVGGPPVPAPADDDDDQDAPPAPGGAPALAAPGAPAPGAPAPGAPMPGAPGTPPAPGAPKPNDSSELDKWAEEHGEGDDDADDEGMDGDTDQDEPLAKSLDMEALRPFISGPLEERYGHATLAKSITEVADFAGTAAQDPAVDMVALPRVVFTELVKSFCAVQIQGEVALENSIQIGNLLNVLTQGVVAGSEQERVGFELTTELAKSMAAMREELAAFKGDVVREVTENLAAKQTETLAPLVKSLSEAAPAFLAARDDAAAPAGTPKGAAPVNGATLSNPLLATIEGSGALNKSVDAAGEEVFNGWTRDTLKKSLNAAIRNDREGVGPNDYQLAADTSVPLSQLPETIFKAAEAERRAAG